ncbi:FAD-dependent monooxygenase [Labrys sp. LIt4]|uniref:FAD-dependent monooxygenase n=1 Tax=Labrys sp. LIt4 TaxID=2821355 RepID=UPI001ADFA04E|nr:FAD-dependent monooxygenase [Labrys sp. LIt4]MBP0578827.1 FAD-dependent monooxygenase [Labrys sp. LIt4]
MDIAIAGAGIGGLTAALALARRGFAVEIYERASRLEEAGAGIQLTPNALNVLFGLGLGPALEAHMVRLEAVVIRKGATGALVQQLPLEACQARWGAPYGVIHRADLQTVLVEAVHRHAIPLKLGREIRAARQDGQRVTLSFVGKDADVSAPMLIGADGVWSTLRAQLDLEPPRFAGRRAWRAVIPSEEIPALFQGQKTGLWLGDNAHFVHYPVRSGQALNLVAVTHADDAGPGWSTPQPLDALLPHYASWDGRVRALLATVPQWRTWPLFEGRADSRIATGRIALIGDAAHPMLPFIAQGGAAAIEDAAELAARLDGAGHGDLPARLQEWSRLRLPRVGRIQAEAHSNGQRYHWRWPLAAARDLGLSALGGRRLLERYDWLYGWKPTETA